jgi:hypothetical protein
LRQLQKTASQQIIRAVLLPLHSSTNKVSRDKSQCTKCMETGAGYAVIFAVNGFLCDQEVVYSNPD